MVFGLWVAAVVRGNSRSAGSLMELLSRVGLPLFVLPVVDPLVVALNLRKEVPSAPAIALSCWADSAAPVDVLQTLSSIFTDCMFLGFTINTIPDEILLVASIYKSLC